MADKKSDPNGGKGKGMPSIPKEIKAEIEKHTLRLHEEKFSKMSWGFRMVLSVLVDLVSIPLGLIPFPGVGVLVALVVSLIGKTLWGNIGWINLWEAFMQFALPFWIGGIFTAVIPTVTIAGFMERPQRGTGTRRKCKRGINKRYRLRPGVKQFFTDPRGLAEKKITKVRKFFSRYRVRPGVKRKFKKFDTRLKKAGRKIKEYSLRFFHWSWKTIKRGSKGLWRLIKRVAKCSKRFFFWSGRTLRKTPKVFSRITKGIFWGIPKKTLKLCKKIKRRKKNDPR